MVGAGLAGLACALRLQDYGVRVRVLEARGLVGGRASRGGADWVHGQHVTTWKYLKRFNMQTDGSANGWASNVPGGPECWVYVDGQLRGPDKVHTEPNRLFFDRFAEAVEEWIEAGREDVSMQALADRVFEHPPTDDERRLMEGMMAEWHAADLADVGVYEDDLYSDRIQALAKARPSLLDEDGDEEHWKIVGGHQGLAEKMAKDLDLSLSTVVRKVNWAGDRVCMECQGSEASFAARAAVPRLRVRNRFNVTPPLLHQTNALTPKPPVFSESQLCLQGYHRAAGMYSRYHLRPPAAPKQEAGGGAAWPRGNYDGLSELQRQLLARTYGVSLPFYVFSGVLARTEQKSPHRLLRRTDS